MAHEKQTGGSMASSGDRIGLPKRMSRALVRLAVQKHNPVSRIQLAKITGLSPTSVGTFVDDLITEGFLIETGTVSGARGRPMTLLDINPNGAPVAGVWVGSDSVEIAIGSLKLELITRRSFTYGAEVSPESLIDLIVDGVRHCARSAGRNLEDIRGVGVAVAGLVDPILGILDHLVHRPGFEALPICRVLSERLGLPVYADNDMRAGALTSHLFNTEGREGSEMYVYIGESIGGAVVQNQEVLNRDYGLVGHMIVEPNGIECKCGKHGCLETVASDAAFIGQVWPDRALEFSNITVSERKKLVRRGYELATSGDPNATQALLNVARYLGIAVSNAVVLLYPRIVFVAGTLIDVAPNRMVDMIRRETLSRLWGSARFVDIRALLWESAWRSDYKEFLLRGAMGLVLCHPYRVLRHTNLGLFSLSNTRA